MELIRLSRPVRSSRAPISATSLAAVGHRQLAAAVEAQSLYQHLRECCGRRSRRSRSRCGVLLMGLPGDFDATEKLESIRKTFDVSLVALPCRSSSSWFWRRCASPPFTTIMMARWSRRAGGRRLPERVIAFAADPTWRRPCAAQGAWLALASGYTRPRATRRSTCWPRAAAWGDARHDLADHRRAGLRAAWSIRPASSSGSSRRAGGRESNGGVVAATVGRPS